jgi:hypothetical protein
MLATNLTLAEMSSAAMVDVHMMYNRIWASCILVNAKRTVLDDRQKETPGNAVFPGVLRVCRIYRL